VGQSPAPSWTIFPELVVRAAGLPWDLRDGLRSPRSAERAGRLVAVQARMRSIAPAVIAQLAAERRRRPVEAGRGDVRYAERCVRRGRPVAAEVLPGPGGACVEEWNRLVELRTATAAGLEAAWSAETAAAEAALGDLLRRPDVQEGVFANSPDALAGVRRLAGPGLTGKRRSYVRRTLVSYVQRFAAKTETGTFLGPINFGEASAAEPRSLTVEVLGAGTVAARRAALSFWAAQALADHYAAVAGCAPLLRAYRGARRPAGAPPDEASRRLVELADGARTVAEIGRAAGLTTTRALCLLRDLERAGELRLGLWVPAASPDPLEALATLLTGPGGIDPGPGAELGWWRDWVRSWSRAALAEKERLLEEGERRFATVTGREPRRGHGRFSGDRFIVTEEATGNVAGCRFGGELLERMTSGLSTVLDVLASHAVELRSAQRRALCERTAGPIAAADLPELAPVPGLREAWLRRWRQVVPDPDRREVRVSRADLEAAGLIRPDLDRWPLFSAPDVMIAARDLGAVDAGEYQLVLSETHHLLPPACLPFAAHHPRRAAALARLGRALEALVAPARPALQAVWRRNKAMDFIPFGQPLVCLDWLREEPDAVPVALDELVVDLSGAAGPVVRRAGGEEIAIVPDYPDMEPELRGLRAVALPEVGTVPVVLGPHTPRILVDGVVMQRERWTLEGAGLPDLPGAGWSPDCFTRLCRWKAEHGLPDVVFVSFPDETKPVLLDLTSAFSCEVFMHMVRRARSITVTEMLPAPDQLWLRSGPHAFCCEFRLTMLRSGGGGS